MMRSDLLARRGLFTVIGALFLTVAPGAALAETALDTGDTAWMLTATALVLFMTLPGLALFYAGLTRASSVLSVLMQAFAIACLASVLWFFYGYSLAFSDGGSLNNWIGGIGNLFLEDLSRDSLSGTIPESVFVMFQMTFAIITPVLVIGSFIQRIRFPALLWFAALWLTLVYFPVAHWVWGGGWLGQMGVLEFAGGLVVHLTAGVGGLMTAILLGPRTGFPSRQARPHNLTLSVIGASILWVGWFGFNAGSAVAAGTDAGMAMLVTQIATAVAALTWMVVEWMRYGTPKVLGIITGAVAGLVAVTPASGFVGPIGAALIGLAAGLACFAVTQLIKQTFKLDDSAGRVRRAWRRGCTRHHSDRRVCSGSLRRSRTACRQHRRAARYPDYRRDCGIRVDGYRHRRDSQGDRIVDQGARL